MTPSTRPLAVVTGASSGIGHELAKLCAADGHDLVIAADRGPLLDVADELRRHGATVDVVEADLSTSEGVMSVVSAVGGRPVAALLANAGHGLGHGFFDQDWSDIRHVIDTNVTGTAELVYRIGGGMRQRGQGRILLTGSIAGLMPGSFQAVYNATKSFVDSFSYAIRDELKDTGVTVTVLMPGPVDTEFFQRADMLDTKVGADDKKASPADVAQVGYDAMKNGESDVVAGLKNKLQALVANVTPAEMLAAQHRKMAEPGTAKG